MRRPFVVLALAFAALACAGAQRAQEVAPRPASTVAVPAAEWAPAPEQLAFLGELQERTFRYFWELADPHTGLIPDRWPTRSFASVSATGFGLVAYPIGVEHGWVTRAQARQRVLATLRFLSQAPQGPRPTGVAGYQGFFYHFLDPATGLRFEKVELSTIDTTFLFAGALLCGEYFAGDDAEEREIRRLADALYARADWTAQQPRPPRVGMGWHPESGFIAADW
ncbi:MAG TPA: Tat pathway signal protein, partial [Thermoanaerobaculia bacterium]|nr:Tat pathway signal protein [Thermoanaerobaculia bacterium]